MQPQPEALPDLYAGRERPAPGGSQRQGQGEEVVRQDTVDEIVLSALQLDLPGGGVGVLPQSLVELLPVALPLSRRNAPGGAERIKNGDQNGPSADPRAEAGGRTGLHRHGLRRKSDGYFYVRTAAGCSIEIRGTGDDFKGLLDEQRFIFLIHLFPPIEFFLF